MTKKYRLSAAYKTFLFYSTVKRPGLEMDAISSAVIGGTLLSGGVGTPIGTMFGVLIKGTISSLITAQGSLSSWWVRIVLSALLCFFIVIQSVLASAKKKK